MDVVMSVTIRESVNEGRTTQEFVKGTTYLVPDRVGQIWIGRGWARSVAAPSRSPAPPLADRNGSRHT